MSNISDKGELVIDKSLDFHFFGRFFENVDRCRTLMKEKRVIASSSDVLNTLLGRLSLVQDGFIEFSGSKIS
jgi:hypothetical protein